MRRIILLLRHFSFFFILVVLNDCFILNDNEDPVRNEPYLCYAFAYAGTQPNKNGKISTSNEEAIGLLLWCLGEQGNLYIPNTQI